MVEELVKSDRCNSAVGMVSNSYLAITETKDIELFLSENRKLCSRLYRNEWLQVRISLPPTRA
jgi:hypothetical protein